MAYIDGALTIGGLPHILNIGGHVGPYAENDRDDLMLIQVLAGLAYAGANAPNMDANAKAKIDKGGWPPKFDWVLEAALVHCSTYVVGGGYTRHGSLSPATRSRPGIVAALNVMAFNRNRDLWEAVTHEIRNGSTAHMQKHKPAAKKHGHHAAHHAKAHVVRPHIF